MTAFGIFSLIFGVFFAALHTLLLFGFFLEWLKDRRSIAAAGSAAHNAAVCRVSLIIPIHNESRRMEGLLRSLLAQDCWNQEFRNQRFLVEIIFVDDCSNDESPAMLAAFVKDAARQGVENCRVITLTENPGPNRKQYALSVGIAGAQGDYLLFTDGDCEMAPGWIRTMAGRMADETTGAVIGPVFKKKQGEGFFCLYQCFDHLMRYYYLAGSTGLGAAGGSFGNNLIVSRAALDAVGGYGALPPSPTEDAALISAIRCLRRTEGSRYRIRAAIAGDAAVETAAETSWRGLVNQTLRWNNGGLFSPEPVTRFNYNLLMLIISAGILAIPFLPFFPFLWPMPAAVFFSMIENTIMSFALFRKKLPRGGPLNLGYVPALFFTPCYFTLMTIMGYCRIKVRWKGSEITHDS